MKIFKYLLVFLFFIGVSYVGLLILAPSSLTFQVNEDIDAPVHLVFENLTNPALHHLWNDAIDYIEFDATSMYAGGEYIIHFKGEKSLVMNKSVVDYDSLVHCGTRGVVKDFFTWDEDINFLSLDSNRTRISTVVTLKSLSLRTRLLMYLEDTHKENLAYHYTSLKLHVE